MNTKLIIAGILVFIAGAVVAGLIITSGDDGPEPEPYPVSDEVVMPDPVTFSIAEIQSHNTAEDCWTVVTGNVYDITNYISTHPGADAILLACGTDGTTLFASRTTNDGETIGSGTQHSDNAFQTLDQFYIGTVEPTP